jgi:enoyl-CoA hydratase
MTDISPITTRADGPLWIVTLHRPEARNAVNSAVARGLAEALRTLDERDDLRVGILTGGGGHFSAGMDLKAFARGESPFLPGSGFAGFTARPPRKPMIAAVEGYALAGGFEMVLACDLVVASREARFGLPEVRRGLAATAGGLMRLPARVPRSLAMELALTGRMVDADEARAAGLLNRVVEPGDAVAEACRLGHEIAVNAPLALAATKAVLWQSRAWGDDEMFERQAPLVDAIGRSEDALEGARAFAEKRPPIWRGR